MDKLPSDTFMRALLNHTFGIKENEMDLPKRASDAGPDYCAPQDETQASPEELVSLAKEYLNLYQMTKRNAFYGVPKSTWRCHLQKAMDLLNEADDLEIDA